MCSYMHRRDGVSMWRTITKAAVNTEGLWAVRLPGAAVLCLIAVSLGCAGAGGTAPTGLGDLDALLRHSEQRDIVVQGEHDRVDNVLLAGDGIGQVWLRRLAHGWSTVWIGEGMHTGAIYVFSQEDGKCLKAIPVDAEASVYAPTVHQMRGSVFILSYIFAPNGERNERDLHPYELQVHRVTPQMCELVFSKKFMFSDYEDGQDVPTQVFFLLLDDIVERTVLLEMGAAAGLTSPFALNSRAAYVWDEEINTFVKDE